MMILREVLQPVFSLILTGFMGHLEITMSHWVTSECVHIWLSYDSEWDFWLSLISCSISGGPLRRVLSQMLRFHLDEHSEDELPDWFCSSLTRLIGLKNFLSHAAFKSRWENMLFWLWSVHVSLQFGQKLVSRAEATVGHDSQITNTYEHLKKWWRWQMCHAIWSQYN